MREHLRDLETPKLCENLLGPFVVHFLVFWKEMGENYIGEDVIAQLFLMSQYEL